MIFFGNKLNQVEDMYQMYTKHFVEKTPMLFLEKNLKFFIAEY